MSAASARRSASSASGVNSELTNLLGTFLYSACKFQPTRAPAANASDSVDCHKHTIWSWAPRAS